ncbi:MAG: hypothetical protein Q4D42_05615 [Eubacteriales bacterium]|nr:hypothetical protein [Eubacteriales bacterium]
MGAKKNDNLKKIGIGVAVAGAAAGAVAAGVAAYKRSKSEQVYHEAELRAMSELDDMNAENEACEGVEEAPAEEQMSMEEAPVEEAPAEEAEAVEDAEEETPAEDAESDED